MSFDESSIISLEEVNKELEEIENKYMPEQKYEIKNDVEEELLILTKVFILFQVVSFYKFIFSRS